MAYVNHTEPTEKDNGYHYSRMWFDFAFENPEKISPNHAAIYFFAIEHRNRLGWKDKFGFPTQMAMDALGIKKHQTYIRYFNDLCDWGFFNLIQKSSNQYSANIISLQNALPKKDKAHGKALGKAIITHGAKQTEPIGQSNGQSNSSIDKLLTIEPNNLKPLTTNNDALDENEDVETGKEILKDFGFNEISNPDKLRTVVDFLFIQKNGGRRDFFLKQYDAYKKYKDLALEKKHNFLTFFGNQQNRFEDGKWLEVNWEFKLAEEIKKVNQKANPIAENRGVVAAMSSYQRLKR